MSKYDKILDDLTTYAGRKRDCRICQAKAELASAQREYTAYIDGVTDAVKEIECREKTDNKENENG